MTKLFYLSENAGTPHEALTARGKLMQLLEKNEMELFDMDYMVCPKDQTKYCIDCLSFHDHELCIICLETDMREKPLWQQGTPEWKDEWKTTRKWEALD
jgi:hypothetical protein